MKRPSETEREWALTVLTVVVFLLALLTMANIAQAQSKAEVELIIRESAERYGIDEDLALAIAQVESGMNPNAVGGLGELGVYQLRPEFHPVERGNLVKNTDVAMKYLSQLKSKCGEYGQAWIVCFNLGPYYRRLNHPELFPYYDRVMDAKRKLAKN